MGAEDGNDYRQQLNMAKQVPLSAVDACLPDVRVSRGNPVTNQDPTVHTFVLDRVGKHVRLGCTACPDFHLVVANRNVSRTWLIAGITKHVGAQPRIASKAQELLTGLRRREEHAFDLYVDQGANSYVVSCSCGFSCKLECGSCEVVKGLVEEHVGSTVGYEIPAEGDWPIRHADDGGTAQFAALELDDE